MPVGVHAEEIEKVETLREPVMPERKGKAIGKVALGVDFRTDRIKALGNGQVPRVAAAAFEILTSNWSKTDDN